ncbi:MAG: type II CAAX endopeptidase family protein [Candidatus Acidiferrales bacterium]
MHWDYALIIFFLGVAVPWLGRRRIRLLMEMQQTTKVDRLSLYASTVAFQWLAAGFILWRTSAHGIRAPLLGLAIPNAVLTLAISVILVALIFATQIVSLGRLVAKPAEIQGLLPQLALKIFPQDDVERLAFFALVATVAVCEEIIYRGFMQTVFTQWSGGSVFAGIAASAVLFALAHLYQGRRGLLSTFAVGALFSIVRALTGSLIPSMSAHFVADITVGLLAPGRLRRAHTAGLTMRAESESQASMEK